MTRVAIALLVLAVLLVIVYGVRRALTPEETRIRQRLGAMVESFNDAHRRGFVAGLAEGYRDRRTGYDRDQLGDMLRVVFFRERDAKTREFLIRATLPEEIVVELPSDSPQAKVTFPVLFQRAPEGRPRWKIEVEATLEKGDEGWQVTESDWRETEGRRPW